MTFTEAPPDFKKEIDLAACFVQHGGKFILLQRQANKTDGNTFGLPAGKVNAGETIFQAIKREIKEETGLDIQEGQLEHISSVFVRNAGHDIYFHGFATNLSIKPEIQLSANEHQGYMWVTPQEALTMDLIHDLDDYIKFYYRM